MSTMLEIHAGDGGADARAFASELAAAIATRFQGTVRTAGKVLVLEHL